MQVESSDLQAEFRSHSLSRKQILGLALFALPQMLLLWLFAPYSFSIFSTTCLPSEIKGISGPAVMGLWMTTAGSIILLLKTAVAYLWKQPSMMESLVGWSIAMMVLSMFFCLGYLYIAIHGVSLALMVALIMLVSIFYHRITTKLLSDGVQT